MQLLRNSPLYARSCIDHNAWDVLSPSGPGLRIAGHANTLVTLNNVFPPCPHLEEDVQHITKTSKNAPLDVGTAPMQSQHARRNSMYIAFHHSGGQAFQEDNFPHNVHSIWVQLGRLSTRTSSIETIASPTRSRMSYNF